MSARAVRDRGFLIAWAAAAVNLLAAILLATVLRPGLPGQGRSGTDRLTYIRGHLWVWRLGWLTWNVAAITLIALFVVLALRVRERSKVLAALALICAGAGLAADVSAEAALIALVPALDGNAFLDAQRTSLLITGDVANGLYSLAGSLLTVAMWRSLMPGLRAIAVVVWGAGFVLSAATIANSTGAQIVATAIVMPAFVVYAVLIGRWLRPLGTA
jgi:hypothetical protein